MQKITNLGLIIIIITILSFSACAPKQYTIKMKEANLSEKEKLYEEAYSSYKDALAVVPDDKTAKQRLENLGKIISDQYTEKGIKSFKLKNNKIALAAFEKALIYNDSHQDAIVMKSRTEKKLKTIKTKYSEAEQLKNKNNWEKAIKMLTSIKELSNEEKNIENQISEWKNTGSNHFLQNGLMLRSKGLYSDSLNTLLQAKKIQSSAQLESEIQKAKNYVEAQRLYKEATAKLNTNQLLPSMECLIAAKKLANDIKQVNDLYNKLLPQWSLKTFELGVLSYKKSWFPDAYEKLHVLMENKPDYPDAEKYFELAKSEYLKESYSNLIAANNRHQIEMLEPLVKKILEVDENYLNALEIRTMIPYQIFNSFFQKGMHYKKTGNYGTAILCFRSAEAQLGKTFVTQEQIKQCWLKISDSCRLDMCFWNFFEQVNDPSTAIYAENSLKKSIREMTQSNPFKNIRFNYEKIEEDQLITKSSSISAINWHAIQSKGCNAVILGDIKLFKIDKSLKSEWKVRTRKVKKIVDNEKYSRLVMRKANLNRALASKSYTLYKDNKRYLTLDKKREQLQKDLLLAPDNKRLISLLERTEKRIAKTPAKLPLRSGEMKNEIEQIERNLPGISPKIEKEIVEEVPYLVNNHSLAADMRVTIQIFGQDGSFLWPSREFTHRVVMEDSVIPPNLQSDDPKERIGDPLELPSESEFMKISIDSIINEKIIPNLKKELHAYGMRFYEKAANIFPTKNTYSTSFQEYSESTEELFKFLASFRALDGNDPTVQNVEHYFDDQVSGKWLIDNNLFDATLMAQLKNRPF